MKVSELSKLLGIPASTIRYYCREGLVDVEREENNYRQPSPLNATDLQLILLMRHAGMSIEETKKYLEEGNNFYDQWINQQVDTIDEQIKELKQKKDRLLSIQKLSSNDIQLNTPLYSDNISFSTPQMTCYNLWTYDTQEKKLNFDEQLAVCMSEQLLYSYVAIKMNKDDLLQHKEKIRRTHGYGIRSDMIQRLGDVDISHLEEFSSAHSLIYYFEVDSPLHISYETLKPLVDEIETKHLEVLSDFVGRIYAKNVVDGKTVYSIGITVNIK